jgi:uncharacterized protein (TIGR00730 family)
MPSISQLAVFCGSQTGHNPVYFQAAQALGQEMARRKMTLVYGGGRIGLMGAVAVAVRENQGDVIGVIPRALADKEIAFEDATELFVVETMHERKAIMANRAEAFVALPGGYGTCDELFEILTWAQIGYHQKPVAIWNVNGFFTPLLAWLDSLVTEGFLRPMHREALIVADDLPTLFDALEAFVPRDIGIGQVKP